MKNSATEDFVLSLNKSLGTGLLAVVGLSRGGNLSLGVIILTLYVKILSISFITSYSYGNSKIYILDVVLSIVSAPPLITGKFSFIGEGS
jgi:hypothetical protein